MNNNRTPAPGHLTSLFGLILLLAVAVASAADRAAVNNYDTQLKGSDHVETLGSQFFGEQTDALGNLEEIAEVDSCCHGRCNLE
jgi:hypothetical protein